ncbi:MAG TPA: hypothetical protein GX515_07705, partial [Firmicutes bacterium]|nr:hypothetical protein [Bacillota bacterium]
MHWTARGHGRGHGRGHERGHGHGRGCGRGSIVLGALQSANKYLAVLALSVENATTYFLDTLVRTIFMAVVIFVFVHLWRTTYSVTGRPTIAGFSVAQMIWYLVITESIITGRVRYWRK